MNQVLHWHCPYTVYMVFVFSNYFENSSQAQSKAPKYPKKFTLKDLNVYFKHIDLKDLE